MISSVKLEAPNMWVDRYFSNKEIEPGNILIEVELDTGLCTIATVEELIFKPCIEDATKRGLEFRTVKSLTDFNRITHKRIVVYTAVRKANPAAE